MWEYSAQHFVGKEETLPFIYTYIQSQKQHELNLNSQIQELLLIEI